MWTSMIVAASLIAVQEPAAPQTELSRRVAALVRQLDDDRLDARQGAEKSLLELGPDALDLLPAADAPASPEVRRRLARVRDQLQTQHARRTLEASRVDLAGEMSLAEALRAIQQQTGNPLVSSEDLDQRVTVHFEQTPFWDAMTQLLDQANARIDPFTGAGQGLRILKGATGHGPRATGTELFYIEPTMVTAVRDLRMPDLAMMRLRLLIMWEPRTAPIVVSQRLGEIVAIDDVGRPVEVSGRQGTLTAAVESDLPAIELEIPLTLPDRSARRLALLRGTLEALMPGRVEQFTFTDLETAENVRQRHAGVTVTLEHTRQNDETREIQVRVAFADAANALESHRGWIYRNPAYLVDGDGNRLACGGQRVVSQETDAVGVAYNFALTRPLADYRFVYETPSLITRHKVAYELQDVELP